MFYDNFTQDQICGIFTPWHFFSIGFFIILSILAIYFSRNLSQKKAKTILFAIAVCVTAMEIIKIAIRIYKGQSGDSWIPLYFCSLFIFAIWLSFSKNKFLQNLGYSFMAFGGILGSVAFTIFPSTSLLIFPIWHPASLHSFFYHWLMFYSGVLIMMKSLYKPEIKHSLYYFVFISIACIVAYIINSQLGTNMMFISNPFGMEILDRLFETSKLLYRFLAYLAQSVLIFWAGYSIVYLAIFKNIKKKEEDSNESI